MGLSADTKEPQAVHLESMDGIHDINSKSGNEVAELATTSEHQRTFWQALKAEKKSVFWSVAVSTAIIMEGYDIVLVTSLFAQPAFSERYGELSSEGTYQIPASWQSALGMAPTLGAIFGAFINGWLTHHYGYRKVLLASLLLITTFIFPLFFATSLGVILAGLILCGIPWGVFATTAPAYASEVCSLTLRSYLTVYVNLCWALGQLIAAGVMTGFSDTTGQWAYRALFAIQWAFPLPIAAVIFFAPESPWWLVRKDRIEEAARSVKQLSSSKLGVDGMDTIALIQHTNDIEDETQFGSSYLDCFRGVNLRRTEIACITFACQIWCGTPLGGAPAYFFTQAGLSSSNAFKFSTGGLGLAAIGTIISWFLLGRLGRRILYVWGPGILAALLLIVGIIAAASDSNASSFAQAGLVVAFLLTYYLTVGPICYAIISEVSATRLRNKSVCLARIAYYISQVVGNVIEPYMINPNAAGWHGKTAFFWAGTCLLFFLWAFWRLPETRDRSFEQLDILFDARVGARKFADKHMDPYAPAGQRIKDE